MSSKPKRVYTQTFGAAGAIIERDGKFLLVHENLPGDPDDEKWNHPAGWIEVGQSPIEAVKEEVREEAGYTFEPEAVLGVYSLWRRDLEPHEKTPHGIKIIFLGKVHDGEQYTLAPAPSFSSSEGQAQGAAKKKVRGLAGDTSEARWFTPEEIDALGPQLRDADIRTMIRDYEKGKRYPLALISHMEQ